VILVSALQYRLAGAAVQRCQVRDGVRLLRSLVVASTSCAALVLVWAVPDATIALEQASSSLPCPVRDLRESQITPDRRKPWLAASRRLEHPILRPAATHPVEATT
jgi:hypothetical protein